MLGGESRALAVEAREPAARHRRGGIGQHVFRIGNHRLEKFHDGIAAVADLQRVPAEQAARDGASDVHFEAFETHSVVRYRVDGTLRRVKLPLAPGWQFMSMVVLLSLETGEVLGMLPDSHIQKMRVGGTTALLLLAGAYVSWRLTETFNLSRLDQELSHLARGNLERVEDRSHWARLDNALAVVSGFDRPSAYVIWVRNNGREEYRSAAWWVWRTLSSVFDLGLI